MVERLFKRGMHEGRPAYVVTCHCGFTSGVTIGNKAGALPPIAVRQKLTQRGWQIGKDSTKDECPRCARDARKTATRPEVKTPVVVPPKVADMLKEWDEEPQAAVTPTPEDADPMPDTVVPIRADVPRAMTRGDRQVVIAKLQDVYPKEEAGYAESWTDERVAADLGVPRAWVVEIREQNFGPAALVEDPRIKVMQAEIVQLKAAATAGTTVTANLKSENAALKRELALKTIELANVQKRVELLAGFAMTVTGAYNTLAAEAGIEWPGAVATSRKAS